MTPERREQLRGELDLVLDAIDSTDEDRKRTAGEYRTALKELHARAQHVRRVLKGREPDQPELPLPARAPEPAEPPPPAAAPPNRFELLDLDDKVPRWDCAANGHVFTRGACGHCGLAEPENPAAPKLSGAVAVLLACVLAFASACRPCPDVTYINVTLGDAGVGVADGGVQHPEICARECNVNSDCQKGERCTLHPDGQSGLCYVTGGAR